MLYSTVYTKSNVYNTLRIPAWGKRSKQKWTKKVEGILVVDTQKGVLRDIET